MTARVEQQAIDFATEALEKTRAADYYELANVSADVSSDPRVSACGSDKCIDPGTGSAEPLVLSATGSVNPHVSAVNIDLANNVTHGPLHLHHPTGRLDRGLQAGDGGGEVAGGGTPT